MNDLLNQIDIFFALPGDFVPGDIVILSSKYCFVTIDDMQSNKVTLTLHYMSTIKTETYKSVDDFFSPIYFTVIRKT